MTPNLKSYRLRRGENPPTPLRGLRHSLEHLKDELVILLGENPPTPLRGLRLLVGAGVGHLGL